MHGTFANDPLHVIDKCPSGQVLAPCFPAEIQILGMIMEKKGVISSIYLNITGIVHHLDRCVGCVSGIEKHCVYTPRLFNYSTGTKWLIDERKESGARLIHLFSIMPRYIIFIYGQGLLSQSFQPRNVKIR